jgi:hypothetical protein
MVIRMVVSAAAAADMLCASSRSILAFVRAVHDRSKVDVDEAESHAELIVIILNMFLFPPRRWPRNR